MRINKKVLIIGGNSSLAMPLIEVFSSHNFEIHVTNSSQLKGNQTHQNIHSRLELDLKSAESCKLFTENLKAMSLNYVVYLSGITSNKSIQDMEYDEVRQVFEVNVIGLLSILPNLQQALTEDGRICLLGSVAANGGSFDVVYGASKAALRAVASAFALKLPSTQGICILEPSAIEGSKMFSDMANEIQEKHRMIANGKLLQVSEVAACIFSLLSSEKPNKGTFIINKESRKCELL